MCGIAGYWAGEGDGVPGDAVAGRMADALTPRGPDSRGTWSDPEARIAFGHRRLAIVDLSAHGHQPMVSRSGRYVLTYNGEVYNHRALRAELESSTAFHGDSDTEVLLAAVEAWGLVAAVERFVGMFAFGLWDRETRRLHLVRDRLGIKPLYYGWGGSSFVFGSGLKALRGHPAFAPEVDRGALALYLRHNCVPAPYTIYRDVRKLLPGTVLTVRHPGDRSEPVSYWSAAEVARHGEAEPFAGTVQQATDGLEARLRDAVGLRMVADVPIGAFLSGGIDSSTVVALMQAQSGRPVKTFSIGLETAAYDEAEQAAAVARHLGTDHTEWYITAEDALSVIPRLPEIFDEPFADSSQIPTYLVSSLARRHVTVALSGDGGDELFAGYNRHRWGPRVGSMVRRVPHPVRRLGAGLVSRVAPRTWDRVFAALGPVLPRDLVHRLPGDKLHKFARAIAVESSADLYRFFTSHWSDPGAVVRDGAEPQTLLTRGALGGDLDDFTAQMMLWDLATYLPDDVLTKVDRASMEVSLEARVPLLDHRVVEFAWSLPMSMKIRNGRSKWLLRQVLDRYVPRELVERPKMGFGIPLDRWLRGPLRGWAEELLREDRLEGEGFLDPHPVRAMWEEHLSGRRGWQYHLWDVLMFQAWLEAQDVPAAV